MVDLPPGGLSRSRTIGVADPHLWGLVARGRLALPKVQTGLSRAPTVNDSIRFGFTEGSIWLRGDTNQAFMCLDATAGAAVWAMFPNLGGYPANGVTLVSDEFVPVLPNVLFAVTPESGSADDLAGMTPSFAGQFAIINPSAGATLTIIHAKVGGGTHRLLTVDSKNFRLVGASEFAMFWFTGSLWRELWRTTARSVEKSIEFVLDGGGSAIGTGIALDIEVPWDFTMETWTLLADQSGSITLDLWKDVYGSFPPTVADTITGSAKPLISAATNNQSSTLTGWTTAWSKGDIVRVNVDSAATITRLAVALRGRLR